MLHVACVAASGTLFVGRGFMRLAGNPAANQRGLRILAHSVDTGLLTAAILLTLMIHQFPFVDAWLTAKLLLLVLYIVFGSIALRRARTSRSRAVAFAAAVLTFIMIIGIAVTHSPYGWFSLVSH